MSSRSAKAADFLRKIVAASPLEALLASFDGLPLPEQDRASAMAALRKASVGDSLDSAEQFALEAIVLPELRPAIEVADHDYGQVANPGWSILNDQDVRGRLRRAIKSVGRMEVLGYPGLAASAAGCVVGRDLVMVNRHTAELLASGLGDQKLSFISGRGASIDLGAGPDEDAAQILHVREVAMIHPYWDMALLRVDGLTEEQPVLTLHAATEDEFAHREIALIGYPALDWRQAPEIQERVFGRKANIKRLMPGKGAGRRAVTSFGNEVLAFAHDASTLGAHSGSAVIDPATGHIVALHFGAKYLDANFATPAWELARDSRIVDAGVVFSAPVRTDGSTAHEWWKAVAAGVAIASIGGAAILAPLASGATEASHPDKPSPDKAAAPAEGAAKSTAEPANGDAGLGKVALDVLGATDFGKTAIDTIGGNSVGKAALDALGGAPLDKAALSALGDTTAGRVARAAFGDNAVGKAARAALAGGSVTEAALSSLGDNPLGKAARAVLRGSDKAAPGASGGKPAEGVGLAALSATPLAQAAADALGGMSIGDTGLGVLGVPSLADSHLGQAFGALGLSSGGVVATNEGATTSVAAPSPVTIPLQINLRVNVVTDSGPGVPSPAGLLTPAVVGVPNATAAGDIPISLNFRFAHDISHSGEVSHSTQVLPNPTNPRRLLSDIGGGALGAGMGAGVGATLGPVLSALHLGGGSKAPSSSPGGPSSSAPSSDSSPAAAGSTAPANSGSSPSSPSPAKPDTPASTPLQGLPSDHNGGSGLNATPGSNAASSGTPPATQNPSISPPFSSPSQDLFVFPGESLFRTSSGDNLDRVLPPMALNNRTETSPARGISRTGSGEGHMPTVPEPSIVTMMLIGLGAVAGLSYARSRKRAAPRQSGDMS